MKPAKKRSVAIESSYPNSGRIYFCAAANIADELREFGNVIPGAYQDSYSLQVDARFDFEEVLDYITNYKEEESE